MEKDFKVRCCRYWKQFKSIHKGRDCKNISWS